MARIYFELPELDFITFLAKLTILVSILGEGYSGGWLSLFGQKLDF